MNRMTILLGVMSCISTTLCCSGCDADSWNVKIGGAGSWRFTRNLSGVPPVLRFEYTAIWTGKEMIVWGGKDSEGNELNTGGRYDPEKDTWMPMSTDGAPRARCAHTAIWTGKEMIVWGGKDSEGNELNTGGKYDPEKNVWIPMSTDGAPRSRYAHTAIWTGKEMIVWGGRENKDDVLNTGGKYDPEKDAWMPMSTDGAPRARYAHTAIWTGKEMIVWGGFNTYHYYFFNTGAMYYPENDSWIPTSVYGDYEEINKHVALWTGKEMIAWWGYGQMPTDSSYVAGGLYDPATNTWQPVSASGAPQLEYCCNNSAVWSGKYLMIWGVADEDDYFHTGSYLNAGGRYDLASDTWTPANVEGAPRVRTEHTAIWTGKEVVVWGAQEGSRAAGGRYDPVTDTWTPMNTMGVPQARHKHTAVWTGKEMIVWGGYSKNIGNASDKPLNTGGRYDPGTDTWTPMSTNGAPEARNNYSAIWAGTVFIVWGGYGEDSTKSLNTGARYDPSTDTWYPTSMSHAPPGRWNHTAVWTGSEMIIWGGNGASGYSISGYRYSPTYDSWSSINATGSPEGRSLHNAVWTGKEMIVWGGYNNLGPGDLNSGGRYDPTTDSWTKTTTQGAPAGRSGSTAIWTGKEMIVWGGYNIDSGYLNTGGRYDPITDTWIPTSRLGAPDARAGHTAVWTGKEMVVWGGFDDSGDYFNTGGCYYPESDRWVPITIEGLTEGRRYHTAVWTGTEMIVWGGYSNIGDLNSGGIYTP